MTDSFSIELNHISAFEFNVKFDLPHVADLQVDETPPLGQGGPNASRLLVAAVANCLSASLLYCLEKDKVGSQRLKAIAEGELARDAKGRLRIAHIQVKLIINDELLSQKRLHRCAQVFQDYCVVTESVRQGIPVDVEMQDEQGKPLKIF